MLTLRSTLYAHLRGCLGLAVLSVVCCGAPGSAAAGIVACTVPAGGSYSVYLSEPQPNPSAFKDRADVLRFMNRLQFTLDQGRDGAWIHQDIAGVRFASCEGRVPAMDGADFANRGLIESMYNRSVLLEIWGSVDSNPAAGARREASAQLAYLLVPLRYATDQQEATQTGIHHLSYPRPGERSTADFVELIARPQDIDAFVSAALGYKALREHQYELAHDNLCQASLLLDRMQRSMLASPQKTGLASLRAFLVDAAGRAIRDAKAAGFVGTLTLQDPAAACPAGGKP